MTLQTPLGPLASLDLESAEVRLRILGLDKHQLIEGLLAEQVFLDLLSPVVSARDVEVVGAGAVSIAAPEQLPGEPRAARHAFVWVRRDSQTVREFLHALTKSCRVWPCVYDKVAADFLTTWAPFAGQTPVPAYPTPLGGQWTPVQTVLEEVTKRPREFPDVQLSVRERERTTAAVDELERSVSRDVIVESVVLSRVFKNSCIQPYFFGHWDLDIVLRKRDGAFVVIEFKHKFPVPHVVGFGLNRGTIEVMRDLAVGGVSFLHVLVVKPFWDKTTSTAGLWTREAFRKRTIIIAKPIDRTVATGLLRRNTYYTDADTTISGEGQLAFHYLWPKEFNRIGLLSDGAERISRALVSVMEGRSGQMVTKEGLTELRVAGALPPDPR